MRPTTILPIMAIHLLHQLLIGTHGCIPTPAPDVGSSVSASGISSSNNVGGDGTNSAMGSADGTAGTTTAGATQGATTTVAGDGGGTTTTAAGSPTTSAGTISSTASPTSSSSTAASSSSSSSSTAAPTCQQMQPANTAPLIYNPNQGGIANPTKPSLVCPCSGAFNVNYLPRGNALFDVQANAQCASLCVCNTANVCFVPINVSNGNILVRFTTNCNVTACVMVATVEGTSAATQGCLAVQMTNTCAQAIGSSFNAIAVSCSGCPSTTVLTCGGAGTG